MRQVLCKWVQLKLITGLRARDVYTEAGVKRFCLVYGAQREYNLIVGGWCCV